MQSAKILAPARNDFWQSVSPLALGTVKFGRNRGVHYPGGEGFALPSDKQILGLLSSAEALGINWLDTAAAYGSAEERLGTLLGANSERFFISSKAGEFFDSAQGTSHYDFSAAAIRASIESSLKRLRRDWLDCALLHCSRNDLAELRDSAALETLTRLKQEGKIRSLGASTASLEGGLFAATHCDCVMVAFNSGYRDQEAVIAAAARNGCAVLIKKALAGGHVQKLATADKAASESTAAIANNLRFIAQTPGVTSIVIGTLSQENLRANWMAVAGITPLSTTQV